MSNTNVVKRSGKRPSEKYDCDKLKNSIMLACLSIKTPEGQARQIADIVCKQLEEWIKDRPEVTSNDIRIATARFMKVHHPEAAYIYEQHRITL